MKKLFIVVAVVLMSVPSFAFNSAEVVEVDDNPTCLDYAFNISEYWYARTGDGFIAGAAFDRAYNQCIANLGGSTGPGGTSAN